MIRAATGFLPLLALVAGIGLLLPACGPSFRHTANLATPQEGIVCFGDSITAGFGASAGNDYPAVLQRLLGEPVHNAGVNGDTTGSALSRLERDVLVYRPRVVIVELGGNDFLRKVPREEVFRNLDRMLGEIVRAGSIPVLVHAKFGLLSDPYYDGYAEVAKRHNAVLVSNVLKNILGNPRHMSDQIHPNDAGYRLLAERIAAVVGPLLKAADKARG